MLEHGFYTCLASEQGDPEGIAKEMEAQKEQYKPGSKEAELLTEYIKLARQIRTLAQESSSE